MKKLRLGVLFSSGKDSVLAMHRAAEKNDIACLITIISENKESYMFHTPNIDIADYQAEALELPLLKFKTKGEKEKELVDLEKAIFEAKKKFKLNGIVTGALASNYQAERIQKICDKLELRCLNPLWQMNQVEELKELVREKYDVRIIGVFAYPFSEKWLGRKIDSKAISELVELEKAYKINPAGEGGEIETLVLDAPMFKKKLKIKKLRIEYSNYSGVLKIEEVELVRKQFFI
jgi:ABC transporter with metal-binding/Fe-S-binding domain ATP-binding protein